MSLVAVTAMMVAGCGGNDCETQDDMFRDATKDACKNKSNCAYCECMKDKKKSWESGKCEDRSAELKALEKCEGFERTLAEGCLSKKKECEKGQATAAQTEVTKKCM